MRGTILYGPRDVRFEQRETPAVIEPTDAIVTMSMTCICGSDLWPYRGVSTMDGPAPMGHEYCGIVEEVGRAVTAIKPGQFVIGSFFASDNTCPHCRAGYQTSCEHRQPVSGAQAPVLRVPLADGGVGADSVLECVGTDEAMTQAIRSTRAGGSVGYVGVPHGVTIDASELFFTHVRLHGGPAPVRRYLPNLIDMVLNEKMNPGKVFDLTLPLDQVAEGYRAMDERRAIKTLLRT